MHATNSPQRNRLAGETSPYLLQHASNPVDWLPWGPEALERAQREDKPILLSIGYSACHWCHVMAHESFADVETANVMNSLFVNVKVDREERPDLDKIYQIAHQMLTQRGGGWPLTMFLHPRDQRPFFGGTYFPKQARYGMPAFVDLLQRVHEFYRSHQDDIARQGEALLEAFESIQSAPAPDDAPLTLQPIEEARERLAGDFDPQFGGFGGAPKFPHPANLDFLLRQWRASAASETPDLHSLYMATLTLTRMAEGGLFDQLGGGFARYSVDQYWMIPHFEKMLYDNAQLLRTYANAAAATGDPLFRRVAAQTADWVLREMRCAEGGFWSTLDADSEGHEGKFYVWDRDEVQRTLTQEQFEAFARRYGLDREPNFEGKWHLHVYQSEADVAEGLGLSLEETVARLDGARDALLAARAERVWPARDEKILTGWNGLAIAGLAVAARCLQRQDFAAAAAQAADFIRARLWRDGRLLAVYKDGRARFPAYLDDYAFLLDGLIELLQTQFRSADLQFAVALAEALLEHFADRAQGGFYFTADDHESLMHRSKGFADEAVPSGAAVAAQALTRLGLLLGETRYLDAAARTVRAGWAPMSRYPHGHCALLIALEEQLEPLDLIIIRGAAREASQWRDELVKLYCPARLVFAIPNNAQELPSALAEKRSGEQTLAYVCRGTTCSAPVKSLAALAALTRR